MMEWLWDKLCGLGVLLLLFLGAWMIAQGLMGLGYWVAPGIADFSADAKPLPPQFWR